MKYHLLDKNLSSYFQTSDGTRWPYYTKTEFNKLRDTTSCICGELRKNNSKGHGNYWLFKDEQTKTQLFDYRLNNKWYEKTVGYIPVVANSVEEDFDRNYFVKIVDKSMLKIFVYLFVGLFIFWGIGWYIKKETGPKIDQSAVSYDLNGLVNEHPNKIMLPGITTINLQEKSKKVQQMLPNPKGNKCYFQYQLILDSTKEMLYESDLISPGKMIMDFTISKELPIGEHQATVRILTRDLKDPKIFFNTGELTVRLNVQKVSQ